MYIMNPRIFIEPTNWFQRLFKKAYIIKFVAATERYGETSRWAVTETFLEQSFKEEEFNEQAIETFVQNVVSKISGNISIDIFDETKTYSKDTVTCSYKD